MWLYLPFPATLYLKLSLFLSPVQLCLIVLSALFSLPPSMSLPPFFFSLFPSSSLPPLHYITLALTHYQCPRALPPFVPSPMSDNMRWTSPDSPDGAFVLKATAKGAAAALQCNESGHCARGDIGIVGEREGGEQWVMSVRAMKKLLCCVCCPPPEWV